MLQGFVLMLLTQIYKWLCKKFGVELTGYFIHTFVLVIALIYSIWEFYGKPTEILTNFSTIWITAAGSYEVILKFIAPALGITKEE